MPMPWSSTASSAQLIPASAVPAKRTKIAVPAALYLLALLGLGQVNQLLQHRLHAPRRLLDHRRVLLERGRVGGAAPAQAAVEELGAGDDGGEGGAQVVR